ncbi:hypothetical protein ES708_21274 [subsurface metagenome]
MAYFIRAMGRVTRRAMKSHVFDRALTSAAEYIISEIKLADLKAKRAFFKRKRADHLNLLGRTVFRLILNDVETLNNERILKISQVIDDINHEILAVDGELERRRQQEKKKSSRHKTTHQDGSFSETKNSK